MTTVVSGQIKLLRSARSTCDRNAEGSSVLCPSRQTPRSVLKKMLSTRPPCVHPHPVRVSAGTTGEVVCPPHLEFIPYKSCSVPPHLALLPMFSVGVGRTSATPTPRCRANKAHIRQSRPDSDLGFHARVLTAFQVTPASLESGSSTLLARSTSDHSRMLRHPIKKLALYTGVVTCVVLATYLT